MSYLQPIKKNIPIIRVHETFYLTESGYNVFGVGNPDGLFFLNGQKLPKAGTMLIVGTEDAYYYSDRELTTKFVSPGRPDYPIRMPNIPGANVGLYTGNFYAESGVLKSVQVQHLSPLNDAGEFVATTKTNWVFNNLTYDESKQGELPSGYVINESGQLVYDYAAYQQTHIEPATAKKSNRNFWIIAAIALFFITRK